MNELMKRTFGILIVASLVPGSFATPLALASVKSESSPVAKSVALSKVRAQEQARYHASAPADAYFGRLKMSYLGIDNVFKDQTVRAGDRSIDPNVINKLKDADDALVAWAKSYPRDPELARSYFLAVVAYEKIWTKEYQEKAARYMHAIVAKFPQSYFGKQVKKNLAGGFTEHYYADALPCPAATVAAVAPPEPLPSPSDVARRGSKATPAPTQAPTPEPTESSTPSPVATATPAPGQPKVDIVVPPCAEPAPASAVPAATGPAASPAPAGSLVPGPADSPSPSPSRPAARLL